MGRTHRFTPLRLAGVAAFAALIVAMLLSTRFVTPDQLASMGPEEFDPQQTGEELFAEANDTLPEGATPLPELLTALGDDIAGAAEDLEAVQPSDTTYLFSVTGEAKVVDRTPQAIEITMPEVAPRTPLSIATGPAVNGTMLRDALGFEFGDAPNQSTYQQVGDVLKAQMQQQIEPATGDRVKRGTTLRFVGIVSVTDTGLPQSPTKPVNVQPLTLEVVK